jgi:hypothetical protein
MSFGDGIVWYGTRRVDTYTPTVPGGSGTASSYAGAAKKGTFVCENFQLTRPSYKVNQYDELRQPRKSFGVADFVEGSLTAIIDDPSLEWQIGDGFTVKPDNTNSESFWVTSVDHPESQGEYRKQSVRFQKLVSIAGPPITV